MDNFRTRSGGPAPVLRKDGSSSRLAGDGSGPGLAELGGRQAKTALEEDTEGKQALKTDDLTYLIDRQFGTFQQLFCLLQFQIDQVLMGSDSIHLLEHPEKMLAVHRGDGADILQADLGVIMGVHPIPRRRDAFEDLEPGRGLYGLHILRPPIGILVLDQQSLEQLSYDHIRLQGGERTATAAQVDQRENGLV